MIEVIDDSAGADEILVSVSDLARLKGVDKSWISRKIVELEAEGLIATRPGPNKAKLVSVAEYDHALGETTDLTKAQAAATARANRAEASGDGASGTNANDASFTDAQRRKAHYEAALKALEYGRQTGQLVAIDRVNEIIGAIAEEIQRPVQQLPLRAEEIAAAAAKDGAAGVRAVLKQAAFSVLKAIADALRKLDLKTSSGSGEQIEIALPDDE